MRAVDDSFNNGVTESHTWNDRFQHTSVSAGSLLTLNFYPCDQGQTQCSSGNNGKIWRQDISVNGSFQASQAYQYDALNRLSSVGERRSQASFTPGCSDSSAVWSQQFNYDAPGNRTVNCRGGNAVSPPGEVSSISSATNRVLDSGWTYDAAGNITGSPYAPNITYDAENRQVAFCGQLAQGGGCAALTQYLYDGDGQRVQKLTASGTVTYVYDAFGNLAAEYGGTPGANGTQYVTGDHLTSTRLVMPGTASQVASGTGIERHDYYPFGFEAAYGAGNDWRTGAMGYGANTIRQKFTGQERDDESTLDFFQARYYSGPQGRFASVDPGNAGASLGDPQSWNGYAYVSNGPMMYTDPDGLGFWSDLGNFAFNFGLDFLSLGANIEMGGLVQIGGGGVYGGGAGGPFVFNATVANSNANLFSNLSIADVGLAVPGIFGPSPAQANTLPMAIPLVLGNVGRVAPWAERLNPFTLVMSLLLVQTGGSPRHLGLVYYLPPPKVLPGFPDAERVRGKTPVQGGGGTRARWKTEDGKILEWDSQHGKVEVYSPNGKKHLGEYDPDTGKQSKPPEPGRQVEK